MKRNLIVLLLMASGLLLGTVSKGWALAGEVNTPSFAIPVDSEGRADEVMEKVNAALQKTKEEFAGGRFVNAWTVLNFDGQSKQLNDLLKSLSEIEGLEITVRFVGKQQDSRPAAASDAPSPQDVALLTRDPIQSAYAVEHSAWSDPHHLTVTINAETIDVVGLEIPRFEALQGEPQRF